MTDELVIAVPSKGRLEELTREKFKSAGFEIDRPGGARSYQGTISGIDNVTVRFLSASEISKELVKGHIHLGVTGADLIHEVSEQAAEQVEFVAPLGFGHADVVIGIPDSWIDVTNMSDLSDVCADFAAHKTRWLRVATKYLNLTRSYFRKHGIAEYRIVESLGATEAAPAAGSADIIVDITSTGSTLKANGLRILDGGPILASEAWLLANGLADMSESQREAFDKISAAFKADH